MIGVELPNKPLIYLITEGKSTVQNFYDEKERILTTIKLAVEAKIHLIQIREKTLSARHLLELASEAVEITANSNTKILVNDRADISLAAKADGVHLTSTSLPSAAIRKHFPNDFVIGVSTHTIQEAEIAMNSGANFATFSPIFKTESKEKYGDPQGLEKLRTVCGRLKNFPIIALGGIDAGNLLDVLEAGASGFAAIRFLNDENLLRKLKSIGFPDICNLSNDE